MFRGSPGLVDQLARSRIWFLRINAVEQLDERIV